MLHISDSIIYGGFPLLSTKMAKEKYNKGNLITNENQLRRVNDNSNSLVHPKFIEKNIAKSSLTNNNMLFLLAKLRKVHL